MTLPIGFPACLRPVLFGLLPCIALAAALSGAAQNRDERSTTPPGGEGPLDNDCFLPSLPEATKDLLAGDRLLERAREALHRERQAEFERLLGNGFERWHEALAKAPSGASVFIETRAVAVRRVTEGLRHALRRRLEELGDAERHTWTRRFANSGETALQMALDRGALEADLLEVQRLFPGTRAAASAGVLAFDRNLESGHGTLARAHISRARWHARFCESESAQRALLAREEVLFPVTGEREPEAWQRAHRLRYTDSISILPETPRSRRLHGPGIGVRPGLCFLADGSFIVQASNQVHQLRLDKDGQLERVRVFEPEKLLGGFAPWLDERLVRPVPPGWALTPCSDGQTIVFIHGRTLGDGDRNALFCVDLPSPEEIERRGIESAPPLPQLAWAIVGDLRVRADGEVEEIAALADLPQLEYQPGAVIHGERVFVMARASEGDIRAWLLAFDRGDGALLWKRLLAKGADLLPDAGRLGGSGGLYGGASQGLLLVPQGTSGPAGQGEVRLFCGTHLGAGALVDTLDGSPVWTLKNRRRDARVRGWSGAPPRLGADGTILWNPADSDRLYTLHAGPIPLTFSILDGTTAPGAESLPDTTHLFEAPVRPLGEALTLLGGDREESLVLGRARSEKTVSSRRPGRDRIDGLYLAQEEAFAGEGLVSPSRLLFSTTRGLYLFDRERELYLLDYQPVPRGGEAPAGGDIYAQGAWILVLGRHLVWAYLSEP